jgi:hypothetical protein
MDITIIEGEGFFADGKPIKELPIEQLRTLANNALNKAVESTTEDNRVELQTVLYYATGILGKEEGGIFKLEI